MAAHNKEAILFLIGERGSDATGFRAACFGVKRSGEPGPMYGTLQCETFLKKHCGCADSLTF